MGDFQINCAFAPKDTLTISEWVGADNLVLVTTQDGHEVNFKLDRTTWCQLKNHIDSIMLNEC